MVSWLEDVRASALHLSDVQLQQLLRHMYWSSRENTDTLGAAWCAVDFCAGLLGGTRTRLWPLFNPCARMSLSRTKILAQKPPTLSSIHKAS